ncbi:conserved hypothetical protein [Vibrio harveyi]|uniref:hypothetical protein n=1 Tax=Gammaproteobacteria TaxID=1236 RepID=UPI001EFD0337|nr:hypothetical protein [Vibrio harveyi]MCG9237518.1 hypothetical protein [Vibrio harveyi]MCG9585663.1 hypothetical protein [Vibrio harveyi]CAH1209369.1 conserved hypothetical protein [Vibrio harveyi]CAH1567445.1 conserved hypothetical protein [Vibrio harveyi]CAH1573872.1 conserved hypothetical protein [Vibrio harveyi]
MALGRHYRAECELRAVDRMKRYKIKEDELALEVAQNIPGDDRLSALSQAIGMVRGVQHINDGSTPLKDAVDKILAERVKLGLNRDGTVLA